MSRETELNKQKVVSAGVPSTGFAPIAGEGADILILGSLPGQLSLQQQQYYAHPQNSFWPIMRVLVCAVGSYEQRCNKLTAGGIALWDVLRESVRPGSMDADIRTKSAVSNDFKGFFALHSNIRLVCFNGQKAAQLFQRFVQLDTSVEALLFETLPSTSPAYAAMKFEQKLARWRNAIIAGDSK